MSFGPKFHFLSIDLVHEQRLRAKKLIQNVFTGLQRTYPFGFLSYPLKWNGSYTLIYRIPRIGFLGALAILISIKSRFFFNPTTKVVKCTRRISTPFSSHWDLLKVPNLLITVFFLCDEFDLKTYLPGTFIWVAVRCFFSWLGQERFVHWWF